MSDDHDIRHTIQTYFDGMHESSADKTRRAFHPNATITGYLEDGLHQMSVNEFADFVATQQPSPSEQGVQARLDIVSVEMSGETAVARVRDDYLGMTFLDSLSLILAGGRWQIYTKLFNVEGPVAAGTPQAAN
jgi:hypothetical protein